MTISSLLNIGQRALMANYAALQVTGNNVANANTPGYSRQQVDLTQSPSMTLTGLSIGPSDGIQLGTGGDVVKCVHVASSSHGAGRPTEHERRVAVVAPYALPVLSAGEGRIGRQGLLTVWQ